MKAEILKALSVLRIEVLVYTMKEEKCETLGELVKKLAFAYNREDVHRIANDILFAYETRNW